MGRQGCEFVGRTDEGEPRELGDLGRTAHRVLAMCIEACAHGGPAQSELVDVGQCGLDRCDGVVELIDVA